MAVYFSIRMIKYIINICVCCEVDELPFKNKLFKKKHTIYTIITYYETK